MVSKSTSILGVSAYYHDSAATLVVDGTIVAAAQEERFTRIKQDARFPKNAIAYCLREAGLTLGDIDAVVFYDKPFLKLERLLETYLVFAPRGVSSFISAAIVWIREKFFLKKLIKTELSHIDPNVEPRLLFSNHHLSHAASAFFASPFSEATIVTLDGVGEWATTSVQQGNQRSITSIAEIHFPHSIGLLYSAFTYFLGFKVNSGEYKLMGLAPYGNSNSESVQNYKKIIYEHLVRQNDDGSFLLNQKYFNYATGTRMVSDRQWQKLFGMKRKEPDEQLLQHHCDLALAIQEVTESLVLGVIAYARKVTKSDNLCLAGGVALNCVANSKIQASGHFKNIWIQPASGDAGGALGCALAVAHMYFDLPRIMHMSDTLRGAYLGPAYRDSEIETTLLNHDAAFECIEYEMLYTRVAELLSSGHIIGWFQGRMEWGPRALGNRSILADPRNPDMQKKLNLRVKFREGFRPFAPSVLAEHAHEIFEMTEPSPYMLFVAYVQKNMRKVLPEGYATWDLYKKLYYLRSTIPSVTHIDFSARVQTVHKETNPHFWNLIQAFHRHTGTPLLVNTSFNVRGEPIVCTPEDALRCFMQTDMDYLCIGRYLLKKEEQSKTRISKKTYAAD